MINALPSPQSKITTALLITIYITNSTREDSPPQDEPPDQPDHAPIPYSVVPRSDHAVVADAQLALVKPWLQMFKLPDDMDDPESKTFMRYCMEFFIASDLLWKKVSNGQHKVVIPQERRLFLISSAHNDIGHRGHFTTHALLSERYSWPNMSQDIAWFIQTCHLCQIRKVQQINILPIVATPALLFAKVYMDTMHLPLSNSFKYIVQARCSLIHWPEWDMLRKETAENIAHFILFNLIYQWGMLLEIVTDNGTPCVKALTYLEKHYHIKHIQISGYNSCANGLVEHTHFNVWQSLVKACNGQQPRTPYFGLNESQ